MEDQLIRLGGLVDLRGKLPRRDYKQPYNGTLVPVERYVQRALEQVDWLVIHHTGNSGAPTAQEVAAFQVGPAAQYPFPEVAYTLYVELSGAGELLHDLRAVPYSQGDFSPTEIEGPPGTFVGSNNYHGLSLCYAGRDPNPAQLVSIAKIGHALDAVLGRRLVRTVHRLVCVNPATGQPSTECPGELYRTWLPGLQTS